MEEEGRMGSQRTGKKPGRKIGRVGRQRRVSPTTLTETQVRREGPTDYPGLKAERERRKKVNIAGWERREARTFQVSPEFRQARDDFQHRETRTPWIHHVCQPKRKEPPRGRPYARFGHRRFYELGQLAEPRSRSERRSGSPFQCCTTERRRRSKGDEDKRKRRY
jgi:hypothetical protein